MNKTELVSDKNDSCQLDHYVAGMRHKKGNYRGVSIVVNT